MLLGNLIKLLPYDKPYRDKGVLSSKLTFLTFYHGSINSSCAYIKRTLYEKYGLYDEGLKIVSDWKWYFKVIGLNKEPLKTVDIDVVYFDMTGISNSNFELEKHERRKVLEEFVSPIILTDYDNYGEDILRIQRINRYRFVKFIFWFMDRVLFKWEKLRG